MKNIIQKVLKNHKNQILFAYLFGSYAQRTASQSSDIDIAVFLKHLLSTNPPKNIS